MSLSKYDTTAKDYNQIRPGYPNDLIAKLICTAMVFTRQLAKK